MIQTSEEIAEIAAAIAKAQLELENVERSGTNPHFRSRYAQLGAVLAEARAKFAQHNVAIVQAAINGEGSNIGVVTRLAHASGQWIESTLYVAPTKFDAQGAGSVISYLRRYALMAMVGLAPDDDDAEAAVGRPQARAETHGATRAAAAPPPLLRPAHVTAAVDADTQKSRDDWNTRKPTLPPHPEENPETTQARQRVRMLINKLDHAIKGAKNSLALNAMWAEAETKASLAEIEAASADAAYTLRSRFLERADQLTDAESSAA